MSEFKDSQEAEFQRRIRRSIRGGDFTKSERDVILALVNHWFNHRRSTKGVIHPGRTKLAAKSKTSVATVKRTLAMLRDNAVLDATAHLNGLHGNATEYVLNALALTELCAKKKSDFAYNGGSNDPTCGRVKMTHRINNVVTFPFQGLKTSGGAQ